MCLTSSPVSVRIPSHTRPVAGSTKVDVIQSNSERARSRFPDRAWKIAAGPLAGAFLNSSPTRHQMPPPAAAVQPDSSRVSIAATAGPVSTPSGRNPLQRKAEPRDVVVVLVRPAAEVAQPHRTHERPDQSQARTRWVRAAGRRRACPAGAPATSSSSASAAAGRATGASRCGRGPCRAAPTPGAGAAKSLRVRQRRRPCRNRALPIDIPLGMLGGHDDRLRHLPAVRGDLRARGNA